MRRSELIEPLGGYASAARSFRQSTENVPVLSHKFKTDSKLLIEFRVIGRQEITVRGFQQQRENRSYPNLKTMKHMLWKYYPSRSANRPQFYAAQRLIFLKTNPPACPSPSSCFSQPLRRIASSSAASACIA